MSGDAVGIAGDVRAGTVSAVHVVEQALAAIEAGDGAVNSFTAVVSERALADARRVDEAIAAGVDPGPLAGAPFAVKNLFDVAGEVTVSGSRISAEDPPARADAEAVSRLCRAGAVLVGMLNMDEYAYGFTTENAHYGACRNPFDTERVAGGSSGGSGAAVAAGFVPLTLGSDTNGSVRVPSALCGVFGLKPTFGRISCAGMYPFCDTLDVVGALGRSVRDLSVSFDVLDDGRRPPAGEPAEGIGDLRLGLADGYFARGGEPEAIAAAADLAAELGVTRRVTLPRAAEARAAAMVITATEGASLHLEDLRRRPGDFDPMTRDRFLAGALVPASTYLRAQRFREWLRERMREVFRTVDVVIAPATPFAAPLVGQREAVVDGETVLTQPYLGVYTQPISFAGLPVLTVPVPAGARAGGLPLGVQLIGAHDSEASLLRVGAELEARGLAAAWEVPVPMEVNLPEIVAEVTAAFDRYEAAFVANDVEVLDELFWDDPLVVRYGAGENLYSHAAISRFREGRSTGDLEREILRVIVTTFGRDLAVTSAEFRRLRSGRCGRQSQTWVRTEVGWRIVTAHVSQLDLQPVGP